MRLRASMCLILAASMPLLAACDTHSTDESSAATTSATSTPTPTPQLSPEEEAALAAARRAEEQQRQAERFGVTVPQLVAAQQLVPGAQREKAASLLMVGVRDYNDARFALQQGVGGIFIGSWTDPALLTTPGHDLAALRAEIGRPFAVSIDAEGGRVQRQPKLFGSVPAPREIANTRSPEQAQAIGYELGKNLKAAGVTVDFAPVLDLDSRNNGTAVGDRSFSADPAITTTYATAFARGLADAGIRPVYKHFPGHGRASGDSHFQAVTSPPLADVKAVDLAPYGPALAHTPGEVMVGHVQVPGLGDGGPSSMNPAAYALLRSGDYPGGAPFKGVIYTDDLSGMKAISAHLTTPEAVVQSLRAGADCPLWTSTQGLVETIDAVEHAISSGSYATQALDDSALRMKIHVLR